MVEGNILNTALNNSFKFNIALKSLAAGLWKGLSNFAQLSDHYIFGPEMKFEFSIPAFNPRAGLGTFLSRPL